LSQEGSKSNPPDKREKVMKTIIKLFAMSHKIPVAIRSNDAMVFYKQVAKIHGMRLQHSFYGFVLI
jgi:soluble P-type ATPase